MRIIIGVALAILATAGRPAAQSLWDDPAFALSRQAVEALIEKDYERAADLAREAIAHYPGHTLAHYVQGQAAVAREKWEEAASAFAKVARLYPGSFAAHRDLGVALGRLRRVEEAATAFEAALALRSENEDVRLRLAFMLLEANQRDHAIAQLQMLAARQTTVPDVWAALGRIYYERDDVADSEKAFSRAAALRDDGKTWFNLGVVRLRREDRPGALAAFEAAARHPDVREQARREIEKLREGAKPTTPAREEREPARKKSIGNGL